MGNMSATSTSKEKRSGDSELRYLVQRALHKLCQPLSGVSFCVELSAMKSDAADLREALDDAGKEAERAIMIVEIFRDLVEADEHPTIVESFDLAATLQSAISDAQSVAAPKEQELTLTGAAELTVKNDAPRFSNIFV